MRGTGTETVCQRLLDRTELPVLPISATEIERAVELARKHGMTRSQEVDLHAPVITYVEQFATESDRIAVRDEDRTLSYQKLAEEARCIAALLLDHGIEPGAVVGVGGRRGVSVIAAFLATELIGAVYVPADTTWPAARVRDVLARAGARILCVVDKEPPAALRDGAGEAGVPIVGLAEARGRAPWTGRPRLETLDQPRYVLFTSGSTGTPKGAVVEHIGMLNHLWAKIVDLGMTEWDVLAQTAPLGFDISIWQMLAPLLIGGQVHVISDEVAYDPAAFAAAVESQRLSVVELVPTMVRHLLDDLGEGDLRGLRWMIATGEELPGEVARRWLDALPHCGLLNAYGPTECSDDVTHHAIERADLDLLRLPIGTPIINARLYVLRREGDGWTACDMGETGELFIGGIVVGRGYLGAPDRTRDAFYQDPFAPGGRLYRTGDAVKLLPRGVLQYLGRVDRQVKISGVRMELGEIEAVLQRHPSVGAAAVVVHEL